MKGRNVKIASVTSLRFTALSLLIIVRQLYVKHLSVSSLHISLISAVSWLGILFFSPIWGALSDTLRERKTLILWGLVGTTTVTFLFVAIRSYWAIITFTLLFSVVGSGFTPIFLALVSDKTEKQNRGKRMSVFNASRSLGFFLGRLLFWTLLFVSYLFQFWIVFFIMLASNLLAMFLPKSQLPKASAEEQHFLENVKKRLAPSVKSLNLWERGGIYLLIAVALRKGAIIGVFSLLFVFMAETIPEALIGLVVAFNPAAQFFSMLLFGRLVDKIGRKKSFVFGFALCTLVPFIIAYGKTFYWFVLSFLFLGIGYSGVATGASAFLKDIAPKHKSAELLGLRRTAQGFAGVTLSLLAGWIASASLLGYVGMLHVMGILMIAAFLIALFKTQETL